MRKRNPIHFVFNFAYPRIIYHTSCVYLFNLAVSKEALNNHFTIFLHFGIHNLPYNRCCIKRL